MSLVELSDEEAAALLTQEWQSCRELGFPRHPFAALVRAGLAEVDPPSDKSDKLGYRYRLKSEVTVPEKPAERGPVSLPLSARGSQNRHQLQIRDDLDLSAAARFAGLCLSHLCFFANKENWFTTEIARATFAGRYALGTEKTVSGYIDALVTAGHFVRLDDGRGGFEGKGRLRVRPVVKPGK